MIPLMVAIGAAIGAPARYVIDRKVQAQHGSALPWGTLCVNVVAALILGVATGVAAQLSPQVSVLIGTGLCGALSTFSTLSYDTIRLLTTGSRRYALANIAVSLIGGFGAVAIGMAIGASAA